jgi:ketosteroid isomerase-like protein
VSDDFEAIRKLSFTYAWLLDDCDFSGVADLLANGALRAVAAGMRAEPIRGREAIERFYATQVVTYKGKPLTRHVITNQVIDMDEGGDSAAARSYFTVLQAPPRLPYQVVIGGRYHDRFARSDGIWRFAEKAIHVDYLNDVSHHFRVTPEHRAAREA